jgi:hypothetical protein
VEDAPILDIPLAVSFPMFSWVFSYHTQDYLLWEHIYTHAIPIITKPFRFTFILNSNVFFTGSFSGTVNISCLLALVAGDYSFTLHVVDTQCNDLSHHPKRYSKPQ